MKGVKMETNYQKWKSGIAVMNGYTDDLDYFVYPIYRSNDNELEISRVKDFQGKITFNLKFRGIEFININTVTIDQDDDINIYKNGGGLVGFIAKKDWFY